MGNKAKDLSGQTYGKLTPIKIAYKCRDKFDDMRIYWECECECGNVCVVNSRALTSGKTKSCGCLRKGINKKHGYYGTRLYRLHQGMKSRCKYPSCQDYKYYGGRGIKVCDEWNGEDGSTNFINWALTSGYEDRLTLDRIDNNGNYEPSNCRWITNKAQQRNKSTNKLLTLNGETHCVCEWSEKIGISTNTLNQRLNRGWSVERTLTTPVKKVKKEK